MPGKLFRSRRATVSIIMATTIAAVIGVGAFAVEVGSAYAARVSNQRVADAAAYAGALAYSANGNSTSAMNAAVSRIATLNGLASNAVIASVVTSPTGSGNSAVLAQATTSVSLQLARVFQSNTTMSVGASAYAELKPSGAACMVGLASTGGSVIESGGATVVGTGCAVAAKNNLSISGGSRMTVQGAYAGGTVSNTGGSTITTTPTANNVVPSYAGISDPVAGNTALQAAFTALSSLGGTVTTPASTVNLSFGYQACPVGSTDPACAYYTSSGNFSHGTLPCTSGSYAINSISVSGGVNVHIAATPGCNYTIASGINNGGNLLQIDGAAGSWYVNGGISMNGGATTTLTANGYRVAGTGTITLQGTVNLLTAGVSPSIQFLNPVSLGNGHPITFGDGTYTVNGNLTLSSGPTYLGNSMLSIHGNLVVSSGASLCGTPAPCGSGTSTMTIVDDGTNNFSGGSTVNIAAPLSGATYGIPGILIASNYNSTAAGTYAQNFSGGTNGTYAGVVYFPNSNVQLSGGASTGGSNCFELVANVVSLSGGSTTASTCVGYGASVGPSVATLVQ
jgi:hypothetical protein